MTNKNEWKIVIVCIVLLIAGLCIGYVMGYAIGFTTGLETADENLVECLDIVDEYDKLLEECLVIARDLLSDLYD